MVDVRERRCERDRKSTMWLNSESYGEGEHGSKKECESMGEDAENWGASMFVVAESIKRIQVTEIND